MQGLEGVRVLELGNLVSAVYVAKLMADLGAEIAKVEEPQGDLARLWQSQGKRAEAQQWLVAIYGWFTEGFETKDLQEARALIEALSH